MPAFDIGARRAAEFNHRGFWAVFAGRHPEVDPTHLHLFSPDDVRKLLADFENVELRFVAGRLAPFHRRLFANVIFFTATKRD